MSAPDSSKRPRTDDTSASSISAAAEAREAATAGTTTEIDSGQSTHDLLERLLASQERLSSDMARLQQTVDTVLVTLQHQGAYEPRPQLDEAPRQSFRQQQQPPLPRHPMPAHAQSQNEHSIAVPPTLANIVSPHAKASDLPLPQRSESPRSSHSRFVGERARAASSGDATSRAAAGNYSTGGSAGRVPAVRHHAREYPHQAASQGHKPTHFYTTTPPPPALPPLQLPAGAGPSATIHPARNAPQEFPAARPRSPLQPGPYAPQQHGQLPPLSPPAPLSAPSSGSPAAYPPARYVSGRHSDYRPQHNTPMPRFTHPAHHMQYNPGASASPHRLQPLTQSTTHSDQPLALPPIMRAPAPPHPHGGGQYPRGPGPQRAGAPGAPMYSPVSGLAATGGGGGGMMADATPASKPSPPAGYSGHGPHTDDSTPAPSGMVESPTSVGAGVAGMRIHHHPATPGPGGRSHSTGTAAAAAAGSSTLQKVEKNRFQASIRAFVDQHFMAADNMRWDYQQSFKAPRNAEATHQMAESFRNSNGGSYERVEHGLGVYFSSLKAKHRTTEDKAMLKQQRDRRRARRIKKAAGRRKVFDRANFPFLADDFDAQRCFVPLAMSPEHTDDDGEVKVGVLPWRLTPYSDLFHHLDSLRPKRTPRPNNPLLSGGEMPPPGIPDFMISPAYISMDRTRMGHEHDHDPEDIATNPDPEDIEMESSSDGGGRERSASGMYM